MSSQMLRVLAACIAFACDGASAGAADVAPGPAVEVFAPGVISGPANDGAPAFTPDGKTLFFTRSGSGAGIILESQMKGGVWSTPEIAPFSGRWNDEHPSMSPDGSYLVFVSTRPVPGQTARVAHIWRVDRKDGWTDEPTHVSDVVNFGPRIFAPSIAADGTIYFLSIAMGETQQFQLYRSRYANSAYATPEKLSFSSPATADVDPEIAPDQSYLVFASAGRRTKDDTKEHLYVTFARGGSWSEPVALRYDGDDANGSSSDNEPSIGPDRTLYFSSDRTLPPHLPRTHDEAVAELARISTWDDGNTNVWRLALGPWLAAHRS